MRNYATADLGHTPAVTDIMLDAGWLRMPISF